MTTVGVLHPGAMGSALAAALTAAGHRVVWASAGRSAATARRAEAAGAGDAGDLAGLVASADAVLSICPPAAAEEVASAVAATGFAGLYVDANAVAPRRMERIAGIVAAAGATAVDGCVIGPPPRRAGTSRMWLSGPGAEPAAALFDGTVVDARALPGAVGAASALKMAYAGANKIGIALAAQALALAARHGVADALALEARDLGAPALGDPDRVARAAARAWRWAPEMDEIGDACAEVGLPDGMARGAERLFSRWAAHRDDEDASLAELLDELAPPPAASDRDGRLRSVSEPPRQERP